MRTPEEIKRGSMHSNNKGFDRYFQIEMEDVRGIYRDTTGDTKKGGRSLDLPPFHSHKWSGRGHLDPVHLNPIEHSSFKNIHIKKISLIFLYSF